MKDTNTLNEMYTGYGVLYEELSGISRYDCALFLLGLMAEIESTSKLLDETISYQLQRSQTHLVCLHGMHAGALLRHVLRDIELFCMQYDVRGNPRLLRKIGESIFHRISSVPVAGIHCYHTMGIGKPRAYLCLPCCKWTEVYKKNPK